MSDHFNGDLMLGSLLVLISSICYALYFIICEKGVTKANSLTFNAKIMLITCIFSFVQFLLTDSFSNLFNQAIGLYGVVLLM